MIDLADFLLAGFADDEAAALRVRMDDGWELGMVTGPDDEHDPFLTISPARVLAECEAKWRIVAMYLGTRDAVAKSPDSLRQMIAQAMLEALADVLPPLALPYADHPDFREEWRP